MSPTTMIVFVAIAGAAVCVCVLNGSSMVTTMAIAVSTSFFAKNITKQKSNVSEEKKHIEMIEVRKKAHKPTRTAHTSSNNG